MCTIAECTIGIVCVSIPAMRPLFSRLLPNLFVSRRSPSDAAGAGADSYAARRQASAMGSWSKATSTPVDPERGRAESNAGRALPISAWFRRVSRRRDDGGGGGEDGLMTTSSRITATTTTTVTITERPPADDGNEHGLEKPAGAFPNS